MGKTTRRYGQAKRKPPPDPPFRAWGSSLVLVGALLAWTGRWGSAAVVAVLFAFYQLAVRPTRCRVETLQRKPCRWEVRGFLGACDWHRGLKRGLPHPVPAGRGVLPELMWSRPDLGDAAPAPEPQPPPQAEGAEAAAPNALRPGLDWVGPVSVLIALAALVRDLMYG